jgi:hypothetical protein
MTTFKDKKVNADAKLMFGDESGCLRGQVWEIKLKRFLQGFALKIGPGNRLRDPFILGFTGRYLKSVYLLE